MNKLIRGRDMEIVFNCAYSANKRSHVRLEHSFIHKLFALNLDM